MSLTLPDSNKSRANARFICLNYSIGLDLTLLKQTQATQCISLQMPTNRLSHQWRATKMGCAHPKADLPAVC